MWRPDIQQMNTQVRIQKRIEKTVNGAPEISYQDIAADPLEFCSWKGKGGTESTQSGTLVVEDTAEVVMWYRSGITQKDRLLLNDDVNQLYEIVSVEDVELRHMWLLLKVKRAVNA
ncbi:head-tail adaptor protein [Paenibacillus sp. P96]|uniref:Head-tail adaptor protein n=1 Tax=Paenibacillus zeirhizosphaerae TaxID=2987519 RepID=A0ABT9FL60_9BACL|nr:head-tail adaptor protein [Paenibacillus sp. P96]MDP4095470.1 head-tail adaptor protein [Paenibacillus sp. P96]